jgi:hypothetical protein
MRTGRRAPGNAHEVGLEEIAAHLREARLWILRVSYNPIQNGRRRSLRTLIQQSTSRVEEVLCVLPESVLFGVYRQRLSSH